MRNEPSLSDRFIDVYARVRAMPEYDLKDSRRFALSQLQREAVQGLADAIERAARIADLAQHFLNDSSPKERE